MPHDDGRNAAARAAIVPVYVAAANTACRDADQNFFLPGTGHRDLDRFQSSVFGKQKRLHHTGILTNQVSARVVRALRSASRRSTWSDFSSMANLSGFAA